MHVIKSVLLDANERDILKRVAHLVPLAYAGSTEPLRGTLTVVVDERDPRLRVVKSLADQGNDPVPYRRVMLAREVLTHLDEVVSAQSSLRFWLSHVKGDRKPTVDEQKMAEAMVAERRGQAARVKAAVDLVAAVAAQLSQRDDPEFWAAVDEGLIEDADEGAGLPVGCGT